MEQLMTIEEQRRQRQITHADKLAKLIGECTALAYRLNLQNGRVYFDFSGRVDWFQVKIDGKGGKNIDLLIRTGETTTARRLQSLKEWLEECLRKGSLVKPPRSLQF